MAKDLMNTVLMVVEIRGSTQVMVLEGTEPNTR